MVLSGFGVTGQEPRDFLKNDLQEPSHFLPCLAALGVGGAMGLWRPVPVWQPQMWGPPCTLYVSRVGKDESRRVGPFWMGLYRNPARNTLRFDAEQSKRYN